MAERSSRYWVRDFVKRKFQILAFANNYHAGYGPGTIQQYRLVWRLQVALGIGKRNRVLEQGQLFK